MPRVLAETLERTAVIRPEATAIVVDGCEHTYAELMRAARNLAYSLQERGLRRGERVAIYMYNSWVGVVSIYGTLLAGGVLLVVNPQTPKAKLDFLLGDSGASFLLADARLLHGDRNEFELRGDVTVLVTSAESGDQPGQHDPLEPLLYNWGDPAPSGTIPVDLAALIYTSGSTGNPKGVMLSHQNMVFTLGSVIEYLGLRREDRILNVLPLAYSYGLYQLLMSVSIGATLVLAKSFAYPAEVADRIRDSNVTVLPGVPTMFAGLISLAGSSGASFPTVRIVTNAAAALPEPFVKPLERVFPHAGIYKMYGMTECKRISYLSPELVHSKPGSVGKAIPGTEVFLADENGRRLAFGESGILHVRGPHVMLGYWNQPELTAKVLRAGAYPGDRVLITGDHFRWDEEGFLYFLGRSDDIINSRGEKVSPTEVEDVIFDIPGVLEAAVVGVPDEVSGEKVRAYVVLKPGAAVAERDIRRACMARLESVKVPQDVVIVSELPKTLTGKIRKESLRTA